MLEKEEPLAQDPGKIDWTPILRLLAMTSVFTVVILGSGWLVKQAVSYSTGLPEAQKILVGGLAGIIGMGVAVFIGVFFSLRISLGEDFRKETSFRWWVINRLAFLVAANNLAGFMAFFLQERFPEYEGMEVAGPASRIVMFVGIFILIAALPSGWLSDRIGKKTVSALAGVLVGIGAATVIFSPDLNWVIFVGASIVGVGVGAFYSANWALGTELVPENRAGQFLGLSNLAGAGAGAVGAYIGGPIGDHTSYVLLMSIYGAMAVLSALALLGIKET